MREAGGHARGRGPGSPFPAAPYPILVPGRPRVAGYFTGCFDTAVAYLLI